MVFQNHIMLNNNQSIGSYLFEIDILVISNMLITVTVALHDYHTMYTAPVFGINKIRISKNSGRSDYLF